MDKTYQIHVSTDLEQFNRVYNTLSCLEGSKEVTVKAVRPLGQMGGEIIVTAESANPLAVQDFVDHQVKSVSGVTRTSIHGTVFLPVGAKE